jgi:CheY-like chemotaxis protein
MPDAAYDGHGALALLHTGGFGAMVLDLGLPGLSGMDLLRTLSAMRVSGARCWCSRRATVSKIGSRLSIWALRIIW